MLFEHVMHSIRAQLCLYNVGQCVHPHWPFNTHIKNPHLCTPVDVLLSNCVIVLSEHTLCRAWRTWGTVCDWLRSLPPPSRAFCQTASIVFISPPGRGNQLAKYREPNNLQECHAVLSPPGLRCLRKIASGVSEREQLRFTNNDEACHASFSIRHAGRRRGVGQARLGVLHKT